ncbi:UDP-glycosyltransferase 73B5 [Striga hermonthica]|uniref:Glycosyltransferase n=1 Tax=Striga hermonthica TaxID=68872 RepID=A0A9N7MM70_STRHE|nr:UDP-glycosyltransferase 73B5 [Striga hermonthica]
MDSYAHNLHIFFLPMMAPGHMIPMIDIAWKFATHGAKSTIITTPVNASQFSQTIELGREKGLQIEISLVEFPCRESGLPEGCENLSSTTTPQMSINFLKALDFLQEPVGDMLRKARPDCIVAGGYFWWATDLATELGILRVGFYGTGFFPMCLFRSLRQNKPHEKVDSDYEEFVVPGVPGDIKITRKQLPSIITGDNKHPLADVLNKAFNSDQSSLGMIVNTFHELEPEYAAHYRDAHGVNTWHVGPVSLFGGRADSDGNNECLRWLDSKEPNSVVYACFGSMTFFRTPQLREIAKGLESSGRQFVWVVRGESVNADWLFGEFQERVQGRGLVVGGWAPQAQILEHAAVGGFVTHCGWNSLMEGVAAGVPMVTWPVTSEQFLNEKLVAEVLGFGVPVGAEAWSERLEEGECVEGERIAAAVGEVMGGGREGVRRRAREVGAAARRAVEEGGSSEIEFRRLVAEIRGYRCA